MALLERLRLIPDSWPQGSRLCGAMGRDILHPVKLAHLADPHLGIRQYHRQTPGGLNQREADVEAAFRAAVDRVLLARPDAIMVAGDLFHSVRPTNAAIVFAFQQFQRLRAALPDAPIVLIAGNHDTPRSVETGSILRLFEELGVDVATTSERTFDYPALDLSVVAVPHQALVRADRPVLRPSGARRHQVLVIHGDVEGIVAHDQGGSEYGGAMVTQSELGAEHWSYVAFGHYHVQREIAPRAWYAGSLEYVSSNPWAEMREEAIHGASGKGWLLADLASGEVERVAVPLARQYIDLPRLNGTGLGPDDLDRAIADRLTSVEGGIGGKVVRLVVTGVPRTVARLLDHSAIRAARATALHFHLDIRRPEPSRSEESGAPGRRATLGEIVQEYLERRRLPEGLDRAAFVRTGVELVETAERNLSDS